MNKKENQIPSEAEIDKLMDFDGLMKLHHDYKRNQLRTRIAAVVGSMVLLAIVFQVYVLLKPEQQSTQPNSTNQIIKPDSLGTIVSKPTAETTSTPEEVVASTEKENRSKLPRDNKESLVLAEPVYVPAEPVAGFPELYAYLEKELQYPAAEKSKGITGTVTVAFEINELGKPENLTILNSLGVEFDSAIVQLFENMPAWKPATLNGKPVSSKASLPLHFEINR